MSEGIYKREQQPPLKKVSNGVADDNKMETEKQKASGCASFGTAIDRDACNIMKALYERLDEHNESRAKVREDLEQMCDKLKKQANEVEEETRRKLEEEFDKESSRLQEALDNIFQNRDCPERLQEAIKKAGTVLVTKWLCAVKKESNADFTKAIGLDFRKEKVLCTVHNQEETAAALKQRLCEIDENRRCAKEELHNI